VIFRAIACDYDGTLATADRIGHEALAALERARAAGRRLLLVTGRTFFELTRVCEQLDLFDAVVAENGAVLYVPAAGVIRDLAPPPPPRFLAELDRRGIAYEVGRVIVGTTRGHESGIRDILDVTGVRLDLVYNRGALMLLPPGISKGTGVRQAIASLGLSFHDVLGLGDAENDLDFLEACGYAGCPANAVPALQRRADWTFPGENGRGIAQAIEGPILQELLPLDRSPRHRLELGWAAGTAEPVTIPARRVNVLVYGDPLSGKSWLAGGLVERLLGQQYATCVIDPEGDYAVLARLPGVTWAEVRDEAAMARLLGRFEQHPSACAVVDLSAHPHAGKLRLIETALGLVQDLRRRWGRPHWVVVDEAHYSLHGAGIDERAVDLEAKGFCLVTYKPSWLRPSVLRGVDVLVLARATSPEELAGLRAVLAEPSDADARALAVLPDLPSGEFVLLQPNSNGGRSAVSFVATPRVTPHVRHRRKYADARIPSTERFLFRHPDGRLVAAADSMAAFRQTLQAVPDDVLAHHAGRGDFSRWTLDVFADRELGTRLRRLEARWTRGELGNLRVALTRLMDFRYGPEG
jgi:hydroxymethylpyrimidine pyrophosphatase-like HAD family hydrolase